MISFRGPMALWVGPAREVTVGSRRLEVLELPGSEDEPPLVLLHEGLGSARLWRRFPEDLQAATGRRVIAFSRYGHGRSEPPPHPRTPAFFHEEALEVLPEVLAQLEAEKPVLVGHSDGASIALIHAGHHPVTALALLAPHVVVEDSRSKRSARPGAASSRATCASACPVTTTTSTPRSGAGATCGWTRSSAPGAWKRTPSG